jgi:hypothetical protein
MGMSMPPSGQGPDNRSGSADWPWAAAQPPQPPRRGPRRGVVAGVLAAVLVVMLGGGGFAFYSMDPFHLFRPGPQPAEALPDTAIGYVAVDMDPMASQKIAAVRFLNHFPAFRQAAGTPDASIDVRKVVVSQLLQDDHCRGLSYQQDFEPWLGSRVGLALMPPRPSEKAPVAIAVEASDEGKARSTIAALNRCATAHGDTGDVSGAAYVNGYLVLAESKAVAERYARSAAEHPLSDDPRFKADMDSLGEPGVMTAWLDVWGVLRADAPGVLADPQNRSALRAVRRVAATFRFRSDAAEITTSTFGSTQPVAHSYNPIIRLPESTVFAFSESGAGARVGQMWKRLAPSFRRSDPYFDEEMSQLQAQTGLSFPGDLKTLLGQNLLFAVDRSGLSSAGLSGRGTANLNIGARLTNDPGKLNALYAKIMGLVDPSGHSKLPFVKRSFADGITVASNPHYAATLGRLDGSLGDSATFQSVIDDAASQESVVYVNLDGIKRMIMSEMRKEGAPRELIANVSPLRAFGITSDVVGSYQHTTIRLSVDD